MFLIIISSLISWPHHVQTFDVLHRLVDELPRLGLAEMIKVLLRRHAWLVTAIFRDRIGNLNGMCEPAFFCGQRIGRLEFCDVTATVSGFDFMRCAILGLSLHHFPKPFPRCLSPCGARR